jgi:hypothetical protein
MQALLFAPLLPVPHDALAEVEAQAVTVAVEPPAVAHLCGAEVDDVTAGLEHPRTIWCSGSRLPSRRSSPPYSAISPPISGTRSPPRRSPAGSQ